MPAAPWLSLLQPDLILGGTVVDLSPELLQTHRLQGLILDVDETLVAQSEGEVPAHIRQWVARARTQVPLWLVSNNLNRARIAAIGKSLDLPYAAAARKPSRRMLRMALEAMQLPPDRVAMVGDRLFTDVLAGNRLGLFSILVEPVVTEMTLAPKVVLRGTELWIARRLGVKTQPSRIPHRG